MADKNPAEKLAEFAKQYPDDPQAQQFALDIYLADQKDNNSSTDDNDNTTPSS